MAEMVKSIMVDVKPKITVDIETAKVCIKLVNWFRESNDGYYLASAGVNEWVITSNDEFEEGTRLYFRGRYDEARTDEDRAKWRRLAKVEDE